MANEIWKPVIGVEDGLYKEWYEVSSLGRVRSVDRNIDYIDKNGIEYSNFFKGKILAEKDIRGYKNVGLSYKGKVKTKQVHRLVLLAFEPNPKSNQLQVNHKNGVKGDNRLSNLEWVTPSENHKHSYDLGLQNQEGVNNANSKLNPKNIREIRGKYKNLSETETAEIFGVSRSLIGLVRRRENWKHIN